MTAETHKYVAELTRIYRALTKKCKFLKLMIVRKDDSLLYLRVSMRDFV